MKTLLAVLLLSALSFGQATTTKKLYISGNNSAAVAARQMILDQKGKKKICPDFTLVGSVAAAEYVMEIAADTDGAANGTLTKGDSLLWSDTYKSGAPGFGGAVPRGPFSRKGPSNIAGENGELLMNKFCREVEKGKINLQDKK